MEERDEGAEAGAVEGGTDEVVTDLCPFDKPLLPHTFATFLTFNCGSLVGAVLDNVPFCCEGR